MITKSEQKRIIESLNCEKFYWKGDLGNCRCMICGDSKEKIQKKRGFFKWAKDKLTQEYNYFYYCHNCGYSNPLMFLLKEHYSDIYKSVLFQLYKDKTNDYEPKVQTLDLKIDNDDLKDFLIYMSDEKLFQSIDSYDESHISRIYLNERKVPMNTEFYYSDNFFLNVYKPIKMFLEEKVSETFFPESDKRIFWFIKNRLNEIVGIQGRSLNDSNIRYLTVKIKDDPLMGGIERVDLKKRIYVTEGFLDSLFLPNSISMNSANFKRPLEILEELKASEVVFVFDNEPHNKEIRRNIKRAVNMSIEKKGSIKIGVTLLPETLRKFGKDINEYALNMPIAKLINIIDDHTYYGYIAKTKLINW